MSRAAGIISGVLIILLGVMCLFTPIVSYGVVSWMVAVALLADGVSKILLYNDFKKAGVSDIWALVGGICSVLLGVMLVFSGVARVAVDVMVAYMASIWLLVGGCVRIARSFQMRQASRVMRAQVLGANWDLALVVGILMVVLGILCLANPVIVMVTLGLQIGASLVLGGIGLITATA
ncbi:MAG: DUF308 domain-containing protein [Atopobiaceae bacterium]|nr:DUF308 domain-containing protein [Atopobiaceae bacterium]